MWIPQPILKTISRIHYRVFIILLSFTSIPLLLLMIGIFQGIERVAVFEQEAKLEGIAEIQKHRVENIILSYLDYTSLIASQSIFQVAARDFPQGIRTEEKRVTDSLKATFISAPSIKEINIYDTTGTVVSSNVPRNIDKNYRNASYLVYGKKEIRITDVFKDANQLLSVRSVAPLVSNDKLVGVVEIIFDAEDLITLTEDHTGLGKTGEVMLVKSDTQRNAIFLTPLRFNNAATLSKTKSAAPENFPLLVSLAGQETFLTGYGVVDYRGEEIVAITKFISSTQWGLIAKIDKEEVYLPLEELKYSLIITFLGMTTIISAAALLVSNIFTNPIEELTSAADAMSSGDLSIRTKVRTQDEIGELGETFNDMAEKLQSSHTVLEEKVKERTKELENIRANLEQIVEDKTIELQKAKSYLEREVNLRTTVLQAKIDELERVNKLTTNREIKMIELKEEVKKLNDQLSKHAHELSKVTNPPLV